MQDIIIGAADLYSWSQVKNWVKSIRATSFTGKIVLLGYRVDEELVKNCAEHGVLVFGIDTDRFGAPIQHGLPGHASDVHQLRFFHFWQVLSSMEESFRYCIATDVRDVIFQTNPSDWLVENLQNHKFTIPSENITYANEAWNTNNVITSLGPLVYTKVANKPVANVGTIGGDADYLANLFLTLHTMTIGLSLPSDQSCFNLLCNGLIREQGLFTGPYSGWCAQLGVSNDDTKQHLQQHLIEPKPTIKDGLVYNSSNELFALFHQYDRVPELNNAINNRY